MLDWQHQRVTQARIVADNGVLRPYQLSTAFQNLNPRVVGPGRMTEAEYALYPSLQQYIQFSVSFGGEHALQTPQDLLIQMECARFVSRAVEVGTYDGGGSAALYAGLSLRSPGHSNPWLIGIDIECRPGTRDFYDRHAPNTLFLAGRSLDTGVIAEIRSFRRSLWGLFLDGDHNPDTIIGEIKAYSALRPALLLIDDMNTQKPGNFDLIRATALRHGFREASLRPFIQSPVTKYWGGLYIDEDYCEAWEQHLKGAFRNAASFCHEGFWVA